MHVLGNGGALDVAKHVDQVKVSGDHGLKNTSTNELFDQAAPVGVGLSGTRKRHAPMMHAQKNGAQIRLVRALNAFGGSRGENIAHLDGSGFVAFWALPA